MCGINGFAGAPTVAGTHWLQIGRDTMRHRGPDDAGDWYSADGRVGLGHRRLSIIDLSPGGHQPMRDPLGELSIVFNGEIYNYLDLRAELQRLGHAFRSHSDTEVILVAYRQWGVDCLDRLNGMFAFGLYDSRRNHLFLARDRAGEKPLFYTVIDGQLRFASELKALMADTAMPRRVDPAALDCYLSMGFVPGELCIIQGVSKLPPASALVYRLDDGSLRKWRYWELPEPVEGPVDEERLLDELEALLQDSVRRQLVADVPVGILLSGGVDSSLVTAMAVRVASKVKTFTIRFPGHGSYDETAHARLIAEHFGTEHVELSAEASTVDLLPMLARQFDEPMADSSMIPTFLVSRLLRAHCTVALGGDGGDELFGGYAHYNRLLWMQQRLGPVPHLLRRPLAAAGGLLPVGFKGRNWLQGLGVKLDSGLPLIASLYDRDARRTLLGGRAAPATSAEQIRSALMPIEPDLLQRATRMDFMSYLPEDILVKVDRASMLNSLEVRAPLLDYRLIEFAYGKVPSYLKATADSRKVLLKRLTAKVLPPEFDRHRKQGFSVPLASWLHNGPWGDYFREALIGPDATFDRKAVEALLAGQSRGRTNSERLFALVVFELWRRHYQVTI